MWIGNLYFSDIMAYSVEEGSSIKSVIVTTIFIKMLILSELVGKILATQGFTGGS
jgi:hypothetical protein